MHYIMASIHAQRTLKPAFAILFQVNVISFLKLNVASECLVDTLDSKIDVRR
jgi:hypothetical protein